MSVPSPRHIVITGASSGIGAALAIHYAKANRRLTICGRDLARLTEIAEACRNLGAEVDASVVDVGDRQACRDWLERAWQSQPVDLLIANAGVDGSAYEGDEVYYGVTDINYLGTLNSVLPILGRMKQIGAGRIALVGSLAGYRGLPSAVAYSASKAAVRALGDGLRGRYARRRHSDIGHIARFRRIADHGEQSVPHADALAGRKSGAIYRPQARCRQGAHCLPLAAACRLLAAANPARVAHRRSSNPRAAKAALKLFIEFTPAGHVLLVLRIGLGEPMTALAVGDEITGPWWPSAASPPPMPPGRDWRSALAANGR